MKTRIDSQMTALKESLLSHFNLLHIHEEIPVGDEISVAEMVSLLRNLKEVYNELIVAFITEGEVLMSHLKELQECSDAYSDLGHYKVCDAIGYNPIEVELTKDFGLCHEISYGDEEELKEFFFDHLACDLLPKAMKVEQISDELL